MSENPKHESATPPATDPTNLNSGVTPNPLGSEPRPSDSEMGFARKRTVNLLGQTLLGLLALALAGGVIWISYQQYQAGLQEELEYEGESMFAQHPAITEACALVQSSPKAQEMVGKEIVFEREPLTFQEVESEKGKLLSAEFRCFEKATPTVRFRVVVNAHQSPRGWDIDSLLLDSSTKVIALKGEVPPRTGGSAFAE